MSGLFLFSQGKPRIILCFPSPVTSSCKSICLSLIFTVSLMKESEGCNCPLFVLHSIYIEGLQWLIKLLNLEARFPCVVLINKFPFCSTVNEAKGFDTFFLVVTFYQNRDSQDFDTIWAVTTK